MKNFVSQVRFRTLLPVLFLAVLLTLPSAATGSKYVWEDTINVELAVSYPEQGITSVGLASYPSDSWIRKLQNIQATSTENGLVLTAEEGYTLPESIKVQIGGTEYVIYTNGQNCPDGLAFYPESGTLTIADDLLSKSQGTVTVIASGILSADDFDSNEPEEETEPAGETSPAEETEPVEETSPTEETEPAGETSPTEETEPAKGTSSTKENAPTEEAISAENNGMDSVAVATEEKSMKTA